MSSVLIDSNVLIDLMTQDPQWRDWSAAALEAAARASQLVINPVIYAEISTGWEHIEELDRTFPDQTFRREPLPYSAAFFGRKGPCDL